MVSLDCKETKPEISPEYSLEGLMLKLKLQYFGHLIQTTDSLEKTLMLGKMEGKRRRGQQRMRWLDSITDPIDLIWANSGRYWSLACYSPQGHKVRKDLMTEQQQGYDDLAKQESKKMCHTYTKLSMLSYVANVCNFNFALHFSSK